MTDLQRAKQIFDEGGYTCVLCRDGEVYTDNRNGIAPMMGFIGRGINLNGFSAADKIVGRAAAFLFILAGVKAVNAGIMSAGARELLRSHGVECTAGNIVDKIINRAGTGICPMEQTVLDIDDAQTAYEALGRKIAELRAAAQQAGNN